MAHRLTLKRNYLGTISWFDFFFSLVEVGPTPLPDPLLKEYVGRFKKKMEVLIIDIFLRRGSIILGTWGKGWGGWGFI